MSCDFGDDSESLRLMGWSRTGMRVPAMYSEAVVVLRSLRIAHVARSRPDATRKLIEFTQTAVPALGRAARGEEILSAEAFFDRACSAHVSTEAPKLSRELRAAVRFVCSRGDGIGAWRAQRVELLQRIVDALFEMSRLVMRDIACEAARRVGPATNCVWIAALADAFQWPHQRVAADRVFGAKGHGVIPDTGLFRKVDKPATYSVEEFWASSVRFVNSQRDGIAARVASGGIELRSERLQIAWDETLEEVKQGFASGPWTRAQIDSKLGRRWRPVPRSAIPQPGKTTPWRCVDNARLNKLNRTCSFVETIVNERADLPAGTARAFAEELGYVVAMLGGRNDVKKAYRKLAAAELRANVVQVVHPITGVVYYFIIYGLLFGPAASVIIYNAHEELYTTASQLLLAVPKGHYFDDSSVNEPAFAGRSGQEADERMYAWCGLEFDIPRKQEKMDLVSTFQGVETDFSNLLVDGSMRLHVPEKRRRKLIAKIDEVRAEQRLWASHTSSIIQKARWATSPLFGRVGRAALGVLIEHQYFSTSEVLTRGLDEALEFLRVLADEVPDSRVRVLPIAEEPVILLTDASAASAATGMLGFVVYDPLRRQGKRIFVSARKVPRWMIRWMERLKSRKQYIGQHELVAMLTPFLSLPEVFRGRRVVLFVDNTSAIAATVSGYTGQHDSARIVNLFHLTRLSLACDVTILYVPSESNIADWPTRGKLRDVIARTGATSCYMSLPSLRLLSAPWAEVYKEITA